MVFKSLIVNSVSLLAEQGHYIPDVELTQWKVPVTIDPTTIAPLGRQDFLFHRSKDPEQSRNLWNEELSERERMLDLSRELLTQEGASSEQYERLGLRQG
jgi:hypothetical protein